MIDNVTWERFIHLRRWSPNLLQWMQQSKIAMPIELAENLAVHDFSGDESIALDAVERFPAFFDPDACHYDPEITVADFLLIEQFMVSGMFDAVLVMLKAGYPQDLEQEFVVGLRRGRICVRWALMAGAVDVVRYLHKERNVDVLLKLVATRLTRSPGLLIS